jgi:hypothetical protein
LFVIAHWNSSWNTGVEAFVIVYSSLKNKAVTKYNQLLKTQLNKTTIVDLVAYTDGLQEIIPSLETPTTGAGICLISFERVLQASCWNLGTEIEVANAEVIAIKKALQTTSLQLDLFTGLETSIFSVTVKQLYKGLVTEIYTA